MVTNGDPNPLQERLNDLLERADLRNLPRSNSAATSITDSFTDASHDDSHFVNVLLSDYKILVAREYKSLRKALIAGGIEIGSLDVLVNTSPSTSSDACSQTTQGNAQNPQCLIAASASSPSRACFDSLSVLDQSEIFPGNKEFEARLSLTSAFTLPKPRNNLLVENGIEDQEEIFFQNDYADRSLVIKGLPRFSTLADVLAIIRGGQVLNIYLRNRQRTAYVAFVDPTAAANFLLYSRRANLCIRGKLIEVFWDECQRCLPGHICRRIIYDGATRNLVIRFPKSSETAESIRDDLDHIHRLEVVDITFKNGHAFISTNGISHALTARSCMRSRSKYKGIRIDFYPDECNQLLSQTVQKENFNQETRQFKAKAYVNRFAALTDIGDHHDAD